MDWQVKKFTTVDDLLQFLVIDTEKGKAYRGMSETSHRLSSSLDRILPSHMAYEARLEEETSIIVNFCQLAKEFCDSTEKMYLQGPMPQDRIKALPILQHYGAPTRVLDWTSSPLVALYFASIYEHDKDGAIWWFDRKAFNTGVSESWKKHGLRRHPEQNNGIDLNDTAFNTDGPAWISELNCGFPFHRIEVQQGFFTVAGLLDLEHCKLIDEILVKGEYGRIIVKASWKQEVLNRLRTMGIHSKSIDYPGADLAGANIKKKLERNGRPLGSFPEDRQFKLMQTAIFGNLFLSFVSATSSIRN